MPFAHRCVELLAQLADAEAINFTFRSYLLPVIITTSIWWPVTVMVVDSAATVQCSANQWISSYYAAEVTTAETKTISAAVGHSNGSLVASAAITITIAKYVITIMPS